MVWKVCMKSLRQFGLRRIANLVCALFLVSAQLSFSVSESLAQTGGAKLPRATKVQMQSMLRLLCDQDTMGLLNPGLIDQWRNRLLAPLNNAQSVLQGLVNELTAFITNGGALALFTDSFRGCAQNKDGLSAIMNIAQLLQGLGNGGGPGGLGNIGNCAFQSLAQFLGPILSQISGLLSGFLNCLTNLLNLQALTQILSAVGSLIQQLQALVQNFLNFSITAIRNAVLNCLAPLIGVTQLTRDQILNFITTTCLGIVSDPMSIWDQITGIDPKGIAQQLLSCVSSIPQGILGSLGGVLGALGGAVGGFLQEILGLIADLTSLLGLTNGSNQGSFDLMDALCREYRQQINAAW